MSAMVDRDVERELRDKHAIADAFQRNVAARARSAMAECGDVIPPELQDAWFDRFCIIAAVEMTDGGEGSTT